MTAHHTAGIRSVPSSSPPAGGMTYGRSRLLLGVSGVGVWVVLAGVALLAGFPAWVSERTGGTLGSDALAIVVLAGGAVLIQAPFDLLGGYVLPNRYGRSSERFSAFARRWARGVSVYQAVCLISGLLLLLASRVLGAPGMVLAGFATSLALLAWRTELACIVGGVRRPRPGSADDEAWSKLSGEDAVPMASADVGFSGGIEGVFRAHRQIVPGRWVASLAPDALALALRRRREAVASGLWVRGRVASLVFIFIGLGVAASWVGDHAGTAGGVVAFGAVFTIWSFVGLLILPTLSRRASLMVDRRLVDHGEAPSRLSSLAGTLDAMQDNEPSRAKWIEGIFHPIPSVTSRGAQGATCRFGAWDVARTAVYLGIVGLSPLGRAVHCNSGRPALWVYLPLD